MKNLVFFFIPLTMTLQVHGQDSVRLSTTFVNTPARELIRQIEDASSYRFFYVESWVDTLKVNGTFSHNTIPFILRNALSDTGLTFYFIENRIILIQNAPLLTVIDSTLFEEYKGLGSAKRKYSFQRDQLQELQKTATITTTKEIGRKGSAAATATLSGYIKEAKTGEPIPGALVQVQQSDRLTTTNAFGFYTLSLPAGPHVLSVKFVGMKELLQPIRLHSAGQLNLLLEESVTELKEITIESDHDINISSVQMGMNKIDMRTMKTIPKILGENDPLKVALTLPGVKSVGEGAAGINVRGGNADQNLVVLNEATIYNTAHFLGFFSVFNADAIKSFELYKSGIPAQFGGRLSSIFELQMKDGNQKKFSGQGGIGPVTSHLTFEIPLIKEKTSLMVGGRSTYSDWILKQIRNTTVRNSRASFYDVFARVTHTINEKNSLYLSLYYSKDKYNLSFDSLFSYHNAVGSLQWRHIFSNDLHSLLSITQSQYAYSIEYETIPENSFKFGFDIKETNVKWEFNLTRNKHKIDYGLQGKLYDLNPGYLKKGFMESLVKEKEIDSEKGVETALFLADNIEVSPHLAVSIGLRYSSFTALGPRVVYHYSDETPKNNNSILDTLNYANNDAIKTFHGPEYRVSARFKLSDEASLKGSYNRTRQYVHMLSNTVSVSPTNTWKLSDNGVSPQLADQISFGLYKDLRKKTVEVSFETYYKWLNNIIDYKTGAALMLNENIEKDILQGEGKAYGFEILLRKKTGKFNGWLGYTYSRTFIRLDSKFYQDRVNAGTYFPANYDKPHDVSLVTNYKVTRRYSIAMNFSYSTGRPITYPVGLYKFGGTYRINYSDRNQYRIPDYYRLDLGFNMEGNHKVKKLAHSFWSVSIYNVLGRKNPYSVYFVVKDDSIKAYKLSIFGAPIPTITYNFRF